LACMVLALILIVASALPAIKAQRATLGTED
jgi:hypothetical protein